MGTSTEDDVRYLPFMTSAAVVSRSCRVQVKIINRAVRPYQVARLIIFTKKNMEGTKRSNIKPGMLVRIVMKEDQRTGALTEGYVDRILTKSPSHPHGIKVRLETGEVGRVKEILEEED